MIPVKIEVIKTLVLDDLIEKYGCEGVGVCHKHKVGEVFYCDTRKPDGLCNDAWHSIRQYAFALTHGGGDFFQPQQPWCKDKYTAISSCNDGLRPVIFKITRAEEGVVVPY